MRDYSTQCTRHTTSLLLAGLALVACGPKVLLGEFDSDTSSSSSATGTSTSGGATDTSTSGGGVVTESDTGGEATSSGGSSSGSGSTGSGGGVLHASCDAPASEPLPPPPHVTFVDGMPVFAEWQALSCDDAAVTGELTCIEDSDCPQDNCVDFAGDAGVCSYPDIDTTCDGEGQVMGTTDGSCWICLPSSQHARACCEDQDSFFDCRAWPYTDAPGAAGQVCALHEDCEPGLVCSDPKWRTVIEHNGQFCYDDENCDEGVCDKFSNSCGTEVPKYAGYGICACPGTDSSDIVPGQACFQ